ncbi:MAG TPA: lysophospholipid acyltransferase family protein [Planctomycetota bacterium]|nr:lysophospholipid acyltransferase family protein [Planctomycetota bacterium]
MNAAAPAGGRGPAAALRRALRTLAVTVSVVGYTVLAPAGYVTFAFLCWWWRKQPLQCALRLQRCTGWGFRFMHDWLRWLRVTDFNHRGALPGLPAGPCIVIANHPTQMDVTAIGACLGGACTIVKSTVYRRRLIYPLMVGAGLLEGPGTDPISVGRVIDDGVQRLRSGMRIFVFPEGSRTPPHGLRPFGRVAFEIACRAAVPLVSVGIRCQPLYLSREVPLFRPPDRLPVLRLTLLAVDDPSTVGGDSRALRERVETRFRAFAGEPPAPIPPPPD